ncbi:MAG: hypothetical protein WKF30_11775 [Pyrinomonadaceae bacterium]
MSLDYSLLIYNAQSERATKKSQLQSQVRLFRDGQVVYAGKEELLKVTAGVEDNRQIPIGGRLQLGSNLTPGPYVLQVVVTDLLAKGKSRTQAQWMDFEVTK